MRRFVSLRAIERFRSEIKEMNQTKKKNISICRDGGRPCLPGFFKDNDVDTSQRKQSFIECVPGKCYTPGPGIVRRLDCAIHWIKLYPVDNALRFAITYPLDSVILPLYNWTQVSRIFTSVDAVVINKFLLLYVHSSPDEAFIC